MTFHRVYTAIITIPVGIVFFTDVISLHRVNDEKLRYNSEQSRNIMSLITNRRFAIGDIVLGVQHYPLKKGDSALIR